MEDMSNGQQAKIVVSGVESKNGRHVIVTTEGKRYSFFETDQTKMQETGQYIQFRKLNVKAGDVLDIIFSPRSYLSKLGKQMVAYNLDSMAKVTGQEAKAAVEDSRVEHTKEVAGKCAHAYLQARLQAGATFDEVDKEVGRAVGLAMKLNNVLDDLFSGDDDEDIGGEPVGRQVGYDGQPVPF